jgi:hypothetical protein
VCDEALHHDICNEIIDGDEPWFELVNKQGVRFWFDAIDDISTDGTEAVAVEMFRSLQNSICLVLQQQPSKLGVFRRVGLVFLNPGSFLGGGETIILE